jgi:hypothetical protein
VRCDVHIKTPTGSARVPGRTENVPGATANCLYCDRPLAHLRQVLGERFCGERCRCAHAVLPDHTVCSACGRRLAFHELGARCCSTGACREAAEQQKRERERQRRAALQRRVVELRDRAGEALDVQTPATYLPIVIPSSRLVISNLPERRRRAFRDHLNRLISAATALGAAPATAQPEASGPPDEHPIPAGLEGALHGACTLCRGWCCERGGNHAYLTVETLRRSFSQHPRPRPRDLLAAYLSCVGNRSFEGSCLFHQAGGCSLPRALRSDTCNRFYCAGLTEFQQQVADGQSARAFFAATNEDTVRNAAFCDEHGLRLAPSPPTTDLEAGA